MNASTYKSHRHSLLALAVGLLALLFSFYARSQSQQQATSASTSGPSAGQQTFATPKDAANELIRAASSDDVPALLKLFGPDAKDLVSSADPVQDKNRAEEFAAKARDGQMVKVDPKNPNQATLLLGHDDWPAPVPIVRRKGVWFFDTNAGRKEILLRRIGANELDAIQVTRGYVEAQHEYASTVHDDSGINQYAQRIMSSPGKQDGLYWQNADGTPGGPVGEVVARALQEGYTPDGKGLYHGYYFKILKGQGPAAHLGQLDYVIQGAMIGGFALVAVPAEYRVTGVKSFIVNQDGIVYQKDLGPDSLKIVEKMTLYNPDKSWRRTNDQWPTTAFNEPDQQR